MSKQDVIKEAWGVHFSIDVDENGFRISNVGSLGWDSKYFDIVEIGKFEYSIRPKSIRGIETNNFWIKIESEADLPKESDNYWVRYKNGTYSMASYVPNSLFIKDWISKYTHYQTITKPLKPIY